LRPRIFVPATAFAAITDVWSLDHALTLASLGFRSPPSGLYTCHRLSPKDWLGVASRDSRRGFTEFEGLHRSAFAVGLNFLKSCASTNFATGAHVVILTELVVPPLPARCVADPLSLILRCPLTWRARSGLRQP